jgi:hypothetical protein
MCDNAFTEKAPLARHGTINELIDNNKVARWQFGPQTSYSG